MGVHNVVESVAQANYLDLPPYPPFENEILLTWEVRNRACMGILCNIR
jgi:hypothetical protein